MDESINIGNKKKAHQKPPLSVGRIAGEIMVGAAMSVTAAALVYLFFYVVGYGVKIADLGEEGCMGNFALWVIAALMFMFVPTSYILGCTIGIYFVGSRGNQTGSLLATLGGSLLGMFVMALLLFYIGAAEKYVVMLGREKIILWSLVFIAAPGVATLGFNLTRRYEIQEKRTNIAKSVARIALIVLAVCSIAPIWMYRSEVGDIGFLIPIILFVLALVLK